MSISVHVFFSIYFFLRTYIKTYIWMNNVMNKGTRCILCSCILHIENIMYNSYLQLQPPIPPPLIPSTTCLLNFPTIFGKGTTRPVIMPDATNACDSHR